jgi:serpin B
MLALAMTANGADGETLAQLEALLGGGIPLTELNEYLYSYAHSLPSQEKSKLKIANSIWFRGNSDSLQVNDDFLQRNADYYNAAAYSSAFDKQTIDDINNWVKSNTDGMIDEILEEIKERDMLFLINAVLFDAEWQNVYFKENVRQGDFTDVDGVKRSADFMHSAEYGYLDDGMATGFIKPYANGAYSFAALLPNADIPIQEYIDSLTGEKFLDTLINVQRSMLVYASTPKFKYDYGISMIDALKALGVRDAFDADTADFSNMAKTTYGNGNLFISEVLHKTYISVDELGTKAGAVTMVAMSGGSSGLPDHMVVDLDRPFVYAIIDNSTNLPIFIGTLMTV